MLRTMFNVYLQLKQVSINEKLLSALRDSRGSLKKGSTDCSASAKASA